MKQPIIQTDPKKSVDARLNHMEQQLSRIDERLQQSSTFILPNDPQTTHANRLAVTGMGWLIGAKLIGFAGAKIGFIIDAARATTQDLKSPSPAPIFSKDTFQSIMDFLTFAGEKEDRLQRYRYSIGLGVAGATVGGVVGAIAGYTRGERLRSTGDLFLHPIDSMKKMFTSPQESVPSVTTVTPPSTAIPTTVSSVQHEGAVTEQQIAQER